jgi:trk system potassium uptake protein TrkH
MQLAGGAGLAVIMLSAITGPTGPALSTAEGREQLVPHVKQSAVLVVRIYILYIVVGTIALYLAGMGWFDAINHAFAGLSTGGFSTRVESIGYWDSPSVEAVILVLMILGNLSFVTAWLLMRGKIDSVLRNGEIRIMGFLLPLSILLVFFLTLQTLYPEPGKGIRVAVFEMVTALTTTGFSTVGYNNWNSFGWLLLLVLMLIGGGTCSTAGGIKQYRIYLIFKSLMWQLRNLSLPPKAIVENAVWEAERQVFVDDTRLRQIGTYIFLYLTAIIIGTGVFTAYGNGLKESFFEFTSTLGTVGLSVGLTRADAPLPVLWTQISGMLLGRLEFLIIFSGVVKIVKDMIFILRQPFRLFYK